MSLQIGFSHPVDFLQPDGIEIVVEGTNRIRITGIDKELVGETAAKIRAVRPVDSYKGKGEDVTQSAFNLYKIGNVAFRIDELEINVFTKRKRIGN